jgi:PPK2 family polyphosphate:nucleotide phosphotransferase
MVRPTLAPLLSAAEVGAIFRRGARTLRRWADAGHLTPVMVGRSLFFRREDVERLVVQRMTDDALARLGRRGPGRLPAIGDAELPQQQFNKPGAHGDNCPNTPCANLPGCDVVSFKQPSVEELSRDFLWRYSTKVPQRGRIGIFNRSYYEEVLVVRVHPQLLDAQKIPPDFIGKNVWGERLADIARFEDYLTRQGVVILKFYLNLSYKEQKRRFMERLDNPDKNWKFSASDVRERRYWTDYMRAYDEAIGATASDAAPWFVVPADNKWFTRLVVAAAIVEAVEKLDLAYPKVTVEEMKDLAAAREELNTEA